MCLRQQSVLTFMICGPGADILAISSSDDSSNLTHLTEEEMVLSWLLGQRKTRASRTTGVKGIKFLQEEASSRFNISKI